MENLVELQDVLTAAPREVFKKGVQIYSKGALAENVFMVIEGLVTTIHTFKTCPEYYSIIGPGELFGELEALLNKTNYECGAVCLTDSIVIRWSEQKFHSMLESNKALGSLATYFALKLLNINNRAAASNKFQLVEKKVAELLLHIGERFGQNVTEGLLLPYIQHRILAGLILTTREATTSAINNFKRKGLMSCGHKNWKRQGILITDLKKLREIAE